jgi:hypothetical protein
VTAEETAEAMELPMRWSSRPSGAIAALIALSTAASARQDSAGASRSIIAEEMVNFDATWSA